MVWDIQWSENSIKQLKKLSKKEARVIRDKVLEVKNDPYKVTNRLTNAPLYSLRVGQYRIILDLKRDQLIIFTVSVLKRGCVYDRL